jgi:hypothetical protein
VEAVKLFRFLLSPYNLIGTCNSVQNYDRQSEESRKFMFYFTGTGITMFENLAARQEHGLFPQV